jgi:hypothetical protein
MANSKTSNPQSEKSRPRSRAQVAKRIYAAANSWVNLHRCLLLAAVSSKGRPAGERAGPRRASTPNLTRAHLSSITSQLQGRATDGPENLMQRPKCRSPKAKKSTCSSISCDRNPQSQNSFPPRSKTARVQSSLTLINLNGSITFK